MGVARKAEAWRCIGIALRGRTGGYITERRIMRDVIQERFLIGSQATTGKGVGDYTFDALPASRRRGSCRDIRVVVRLG